MLRFVKSIVVILCFSAISAKGLDDDLDEPIWNVFGPDDRKPILSREYPWSAIGFLSNGCTATLVSRDIILTAAHCLYDANTFQLRKWVVFTPNRILRDPRTASYRLVKVWAGTNKPKQSSRLDWAFAKLSSPIGDKYGWLGVTLQERDIVSTAGYASNFNRGRTGSVHQNCHVKKRLKGFFFHDCDMGRGASGGPVFYAEDRKAYIVGINVGEYRGKGGVSLNVPEYSDAQANIAVPSSAFFTALSKEIRGR